MAVKAGGGPDPEKNRQLAQVIADAKVNNVPRDVIERQLSKANAATTIGEINIQYSKYALTYVWSHIKPFDIITLCSHTSISRNLIITVPHYNNYCTRNHNYNKFNYIHYQISNLPYSNITDMVGSDS